MFVDTVSAYVSSYGGGFLWSHSELVSRMINETYTIMFADTVSVYVSSHGGGFLRSHGELVNRMIERTRGSDREQ